MSNNFPEHLLTFPNIQHKWTLCSVTTIAVDLHIYMEKACPKSHNLPLYLYFIPSLAFRRALHTQRHAHKRWRGMKDLHLSKPHHSTVCLLAPSDLAKQRPCFSHNPPSSFSLSTDSIMKHQRHTTNYLFQPCVCERGAFSKVRWKGKTLLCRCVLGFSLKK